VGKGASALKDMITAEWTIEGLTKRWSEPLTGKKIIKVKLESRKLKGELALVSGRSACSR
jgi:hypothetical protein